MGQRHARRGRTARAGALGAAALAVLLLWAGPAVAGKQKVVSGATTLTVSSATVAALTAEDVAVIDVAPVSFRFLWDGDVSWSFRMPMTGGGGFDPSAGRGTLVHKGGLRFVNVATGASLSLKGFRASVNGSSGVVLEAAVGGPPVTRADVMVSMGAPQIVRKGKQVVIRGAQFRLTPQLVVALQTALVGTFDADGVFATGDLRFKLR
jgi:hypothetical protein